MKANNTANVPSGKIDFRDPDSGKIVKAPEPPKHVPNANKVDASSAFEKLRTNPNFRTR